MHSLNDMLVVSHASEDPARTTRRLENTVRPPPISPDIHHELGQAFLRIGQPLAAVYQFIRGVRSNPQDDRGYYAVAHLAAQRGKSRLARRVLELGLRHVPDSWILRYALEELSGGPREDLPEWESPGTWAS